MILETGIAAQENETGGQEMSDQGGQNCLPPVEAECEQAGSLSHDQRLCIHTEFTPGQGERTIWKLDMLKARTDQKEK